MSVIPISLNQLQPLSPEQHREWCAQLEAGDILYFPQTPIAIPEIDLQFLLGQQQTDSSLHKNIAYKPNIDRLSGVDTKTADAEAVAKLQGIMRKYSKSVTEFLTGFLEPYKANWQLDYASFRPQEEEGRDLPQRRRNDLLHTDAFPTRPTYGARILRFFNNIHPARTRDWVVSDPFAAIVKQFAPSEIAPRVDSALSRAAKSLGRGIGLDAAIPSIKRSPYDDFMMRFHNFLKENPDFQANCPKHSFNFPSGSSWMVYTDTVPHAVLAGQYALEQTFLVCPEALVRPEISPLKVLESIAGASLV
ncbi:Kdo hydroxylase family protein [Alloacidobacterium sp.]|uniref:Kdo hydroxylase family protein n=1 Tax=Alloacidobacterium sp. TaxID=2951999 RepID=UPI002D410693|nr:Kdo hydroxylase family protein [Alloacidobacterium sp.]HYK38073.1 Kdo hydroxylase family protein [Alloacidobacterium sp.]